MLPSDYQRKLDYGLRVHVIVRDTEIGALGSTQNLLCPSFDDDFGREIRERALDSSSLGVAHQKKISRRSK